MTQTQIDYLELIAEANKIFQQQYPGSVLFSALGTPASGVAKQAGDLTNWLFKADVGKGMTAQMSYVNGAFDQPAIIGSWFGLQFLPLPQGKILLPEAINILNQNGYTQGFGNAGMGTAATLNAQPMFWFCVSGQTQGVSASTGEFFSNLFPCSPSGLPGELQNKIKAE